MTSTTSAVPTTEGLSLDSTALRLRRLTGIACLPGLFIIMIVGTAIDPLDDKADSATTFQQAAGHLGAVHVLAWMELLTAPVCIAGLLALVGAIRSRGAGWANAVGVLGVLSGLGQMGIGLNHMVVLGLAHANLTDAQRVDALDRFHSVGGPVVVLFFLMALAYPLAGVAAWRAGRSSRAILVPSLLFLLTAFLPEGTVTSYIPFVVGAVLGGWLARDVLIRR